MNFDAVVVGTAQAGPFLAQRLAPIELEPLLDYLLEVQAVGR